MGIISKLNYAKFKDIEELLNELVIIRISFLNGLQMNCLDQNKATPNIFGDSLRNSSITKIICLYLEHLEQVTATITECRPKKL